MSEKTVSLTRSETIKRYNELVSLWKSTFKQSTPSRRDVSNMCLEWHSLLLADGLTQAALQAWECAEWIESTSTTKRQYKALCTSWRNWEFPRIS